MQHNEGDEVIDQALSDVEQRRGPDDSMVADESIYSFSLRCATLKCVSVCVCVCVCVCVTGDRI